MAFAREIFQKVFKSIPFRQMNKDGKDSYYTTIGGTMVRMSNHCTHMDTWEQYLNVNPRLEKYKILSLVFENYDNTFTEECLHLNKYRKKMIEIDEYVFKLHGNGQYFTKKDIDVLIYCLEDMYVSNHFKELTNKSIPYHRISRNPSGFPQKVDRFEGDDYYSKLRKYREWNGQMYESKNNKNMKQTKKITESQLRTIVAESVKKVLKEKYDPWKRCEREDGSIDNPRYEKDTQKYRNMLDKQGSNLYKHIGLFLQTLSHAYPNFPNAKEYNDFHRTLGGYGGMAPELEDALESAKEQLSRYLKQGGNSNDLGDDYSRDDYGY